MCPVFFQVKRNERQEKRRSFIVDAAFVILKVFVKLKPRFDHMLSCLSLWTKHELNQESCPRGGALDDFVRWEVSPGVGAFVQTRQ